MRDYTFNRVKRLLPRTIPGRWIGSDESLLPDVQTIQELIQHDKWLWETSDYDKGLHGYIMDIEYETVKYYYDEVLLDLVKAEYRSVESRGQAQELIEHCEQELFQEIENRLEGSVTEDLINNIPQITMYYSPGHFVETGYHSTPEDKQVQVKEIKRVLGIKGPLWDKKIESLLANASYGGELVIYFYERPKKFYKNGIKGNTLIFKHPRIAIIDTFNGSGDDEEFTNLDIVMPFDNKKVYVEGTSEYSYTYQVCQKVDGWCRDTIVRWDVRDWPEDTEMYRGKIFVTNREVRKRPLPIHRQRVHNGLKRVKYPSIYLIKHKGRYKRVYCRVWNGRIIETFLSSGERVCLPTMN